MTGFIPALLTAAEAPAQPPAARPDPLLDLSLDQLSSLEVNSVAGIGQNWFQSPASLFVLTGDEIRRSGHRSIAEALRMVPGMFVGRTDSNSWSISARGFNGGLATKSLILIDGRTVYDPLFSGTFWDVQDVLMEDIDQIEVINGPGATLWGSNAVNGVVNVTTRSAKQTQGFYLSGGAGTEERGFGAMRYGGRLSDNAWFRVWGKYFNYADSDALGGGSAHDDWDLAHGGLRIDVEGDDQTTLTLNTEIYGSGRIGATARQAVPNAHLTFVTTPQDGRAAGGHMLARFTKDIDPGTGWSIQGYYDRTERVTSTFEVSRDTADLDFRHHFTLGDQHAIIWGLAARHTSDRTHASPVIQYDPRSRSLDTFSGFVQDTITLIPDHLFVMAGTKLEHNDSTGFEIQPSVRAWLTPDDRQTIWAGVSRAVRVPSRTEDDSILTVAVIDTGLFSGGPPSGVFLPLNLTGTDDSRSEELIAYAAGYRVKLTDQLTIDTAVFFHDYRRILAVPATIFADFSDDGTAESYGGTVSINWRVTDAWRLVGAYSYTDVQVHGPVAASDEGNTPHHMAQLRSYVDITQDIEFNGALYYVDSVPEANVKSYLRLDLGLTWRPTEHLELSIWGQNLLDANHTEFSDIEVPRSVFVQATLRF